MSAPGNLLVVLVDLGEATLVAESLLDLLLLPGVGALLVGLLVAGVLVLLAVPLDGVLAGVVLVDFLVVAALTGSVLLDLERAERVGVLLSDSFFVLGAAL